MIRTTTTLCLFLTTMAWLVCGCEPSDKPTPTAAPTPTSSGPGGGLDGQNVLLITLDTTRADRIGCYGHETAATPALDAIAARGTLFEQAFSQVPLTLPSHASIMTGRYPREHGIRNNNRAGLAENFPTLASTFKEHGYATGAFIASYVLDSHFGLDRGFDVYNDEMSTSRVGTQPAKWQEPADTITNRALEWLDTVSGKPFFAWVHYYDPHEPYTPPEEFAKKFEDPYDGEVAFVDTQVRRLMDWLEAGRLAERTLIIVVGDHGESFSEHGEKGHAIFCYETNLRVPMFFAHPKAIRTGLRVPAIVETVDLFPTILNLFEWPTPPGMHSRSLVDALEGKEIDDVASYAESHHAKDAFNWAEQRSLTTARWKYISTTRPELYDRQEDPGEKRNIIVIQPDVAKNMLDALKLRYADMTPGKAVEVEDTPEQQMALRSLGYLDGNKDIIPDSDEFLTPDLHDPKDKLILLEQMKAGMQAARQGDHEIAIELLTNVWKECPYAVAAATSLAFAQLQAGLAELAEITLDDVLKQNPRDYAANVIMGDVKMVLKRPEDAASHYTLALGNDLPYADVHAKLGIAQRQLGQIDSAIEHFQKSIELMPTFSDAHFELAMALEEKGDNDGAIRHYQQAVEHTPKYLRGYYNLGMALIKADRVPEAVAAFQAAIDMKPDYGDAMINLGLALRKLGRGDEAREAIEKAKEIPEVAAKAHYLLGVLHADVGEVDRTVELYEKALTIRPFDPSPVTELAKYYVLVARKPKEALRVLGIGVENDPDNVDILLMLADMLATSSNDALRSGSDAVRFAEQAATLTDNQSPGVLRVLGAANAETGRFDRAISTAEKALTLAESQGKRNVAERLRQDLDNYHNKQPIRSPEY